MLKRKDYCIYATFFYINLMATTQQKKKSRTETHNVKKRKHRGEKNQKIKPN